jgi:hypothetical protein
VPPERPEPITVNIMPFLEGDIGEVTVDLFSERFDTVFTIVRAFIIIGFTISLLIVTSKIIKW